MTGDDQRVGRGSDWARKHYKPMIVVRALLAPWILFVTVFLCMKGYWWALISFRFSPSISGFCAASCGTRTRKAGDPATAPLVKTDYAVRTATVSANAASVASGS